MGEMDKDGETVKSDGGVKKKDQSNEGNGSKDDHAPEAKSGARLEDRQADDDGRISNAVSLLQQRYRCVPSPHIEPESC